MSLSASELLRWGDLESRRRRSARGLAGLLSSPPVAALLIAIAIGLEVYRRTQLENANIGPLGFALFAIAIAQILVVFGTPYRMYWRSDSAFLARLSIDGASLFKLAYWRSWRAASLAALPGASAAAVIAAVGAPEVALRLGILTISCALLAGLAAPAACLAGGAIVASDKAQAMIDSFGGETRPPGVAWLGALPGLVAMSIALVAIMSADWVATQAAFSSQSLVICAGAAGAAAVAFAWAVRAAPGVLIEAQREVAALDQERLAHIERSGAGPLERLWAGLAVRGRHGRLVYDKDAALMRRRYPAPYFVAFIGIVTAWVLAATSKMMAAHTVVWALAVYSIVMASRHVSKPVEHQRLLRTVSLPPQSIAAAKRGAVILRALAWVAVPGASVLVFASDGASGAITSAAISPAAALALALAAGIGMARVKA